MLNCDINFNPKRCWSVRGPASLQLDVWQLLFPKLASLQELCWRSVGLSSKLDKRLRWREKKLRFVLVNNVWVLVFSFDPNCVPIPPLWLRVIDAPGSNLYRHWQVDSRANIHIPVVSAFGSPQLGEHLRPPRQNTAAVHRDQACRRMKCDISKTYLCRIIIATLSLSFIYGEWFSIIKWVAVGGQRCTWLCMPVVCLKSIFTAGRIPGQTRWRRRVCDVDAEAKHKCRQKMLLWH